MLEVVKYRGSSFFDLSFRMVNNSFFHSPTLIPSNIEEIRIDSKVVVSLIKL